MRIVARMPKNDNFTYLMCTRETEYLLTFLQKELTISIYYCPLQFKTQLTKEIQ